MPRQRSFRTQSLILKRRDFGEADRLITLLTPNHGKVDVIAKGARKAVSKKTGHVELYTRADVLIARGRELGILAQAEVIEPFLELRENLQRGAYANYAVELLDRFISPGEEDMLRPFQLLDQTFTRLCNEADPQLVVRYFEMQFLEMVGYRPELSECVITHEMLMPEDQYFSFAEGGVVSRDGAPHTGNLVALSLNTLKLLRHLQRSPFSQVQKLHIKPREHGEAERIMLGYITHILETKLQSVDFIRRIRTFPRAD